MPEQRNESSAASSDSMDDRLDRALEDVEAGRGETFDNSEDFLASLDESPAARIRFAWLRAYRFEDGKVMHWRMVPDGD